MPGIQLHASVADTVRQHLLMAPAPAWTAVAAVAAGAIATGLMSATLPFWGAAAGAALLVAGWTGFSLAAFDRGLWLVLAQPIFATGLALFVGTAYRYFIEDAEKRKVSRLFGRYVSRDVYKQQFEIGQRGLLDLLDADNELYLANDNLITAKYAEIFANFRLLATMGSLQATLGITPLDSATR